MKNNINILDHVELIYSTAQRHKLNVAKIEQEYKDKIKQELKRFRQELADNDIIVKGENNGGN